MIDGTRDADVAGSGASGSTWLLEAVTATINAPKIFIPPPAIIT
jgi:hypothetical protein